MSNANNVDTQFTTAFLVLNIGSEMVFVIAHRLNAQNIPREKCDFVLDEIISVLISPQLIAEISKPQRAYGHEEVRNLIEDIAQCSAMRLDGSSMNKLWDLITMVFKWQINHCDDLIKLTQRHLYEIENYVTQPETQLQLHRVQNLIDNYAKTLSPQEIDATRKEIINWHRNFFVRVSLLLRLGLQNMDGAFVPSDDPICVEILRNLGENIYAVTENGRILERTDENENRNENNNNNNNEMKLFVNEILGERSNNGHADSDTSAVNSNLLKLTINTEDENQLDNDRCRFDNINVDANDNNSQLRGLLDDMTLNGTNDNVEDTNFKDDLIDMIVQES